MLGINTVALLFFIADPDCHLPVNFFVLCKDSKPSSCCIVDSRLAVLHCWHATVSADIHKYT